MKQTISALLSKETNLSKDEIENLIETPPSSALGDYCFPCFALAKQFKKNPNQIAGELARKISSKIFEKIESNGPYVNFFVDKKKLTEETLRKIKKEKNRYGSSKEGKNKNVVIEFSSPNIAKPFGIGHLRSTIIGNSISNIAEFMGYKAIRLNYLGDWGTQFGYLIAGHKKFGSEKKLERDPIKYLLEIYTRAVSENLEDEARKWFKKLEEKNKEALKIWQKFRELSLEEFDRIYSNLGIKFNLISGESFYQEKMEEVIKELKKRDLLEFSDGAQIVNLEKYDLGIALIKKSDGSTLYITRDLAAAIDRYKKYKFEKMFYEVGAEQSLHFKQLFQILGLLGNSWAYSCKHIEHGLYLDKDGKKFATRKGKTIFMEDIIEDTISLAKKEILKRNKLSQQELKKRAEKISLAAIFYGDLKNHRINNIVFDINRFLSFEGDTGPYLLYSYARAKSILKKAKRSSGKLLIPKLTNAEKNLVFELSLFPATVKKAFDSLSPNIIANYSHQIAQSFNEFYHSNKVIGSEEESFRLVLVDAFSQVLKNSLNLLGIQTLESM